MTADRPNALLLAWLAAHPPRTPPRPKTDAELAAEDYAATLGEAAKDEALMGVGDDRWPQEAADNWTEREWTG